MLVRVVSVKMAELSSLKCSSSWKATRKLAKNGQNWLFRKSKLAKALQQPGKCMFRKKWLNLAQLVKNPPAMWENWVWSLGLEDPLEKGKATHSGLENSRDYIVHGVAKSQTRLSNFHFLPVIVLNPSLLVTHFILKKFLSDRKWHLVTHHCLFLEGNRQVQPAHERRKIKLHLLEEDMLKDSQTCSWASYQHAGCEDFLAGQWLRTTLQNRGCEFDPYLGN